MSHSRTVPSSLPVASVRPSPLMAPAVSGPACPLNEPVSGFQVAVDHTRAELPRAPAAADDQEPPVRAEPGEGDAVPGMHAQPAPAFAHVPDLERLEPSPVLGEHDRQPATVGAHLRVRQGPAEA